MGTLTAAAIIAATTTFIIMAIIHYFWQKFMDKKLAPEGKVEVEFDNKEKT